MVERDPFGIERERAIKKSGVREVFTPHKPVESIQLFFGREKEVRSIVEVLNTPGQHAILFGDRGVGKSSLANIASTLLHDVVGGQLLRKRCDSSDTFSSIVSIPLKYSGYNVERTESSESSNFTIGSPGIAGYNKSSTSKIDKTININSPSWVAENISDIQGLFIIDEVDAIPHPLEKKKVAELIKHLSDLASKLKILLVGIADTAAELTEGHPSVQRCLLETRLRRMDTEELKAIVVGGQKRLSLNFSKEAIDKIVNLSSGYPHFTHLIALKAAEEAISDERTSINVGHIIHATERARNGAENSLKNSYDKATISNMTEEYRRIVLAAALCKEDSFTASELRDSYMNIWKSSISQASLNNYFQKLVSMDGSCILRRIAKGIYKFSDPRMPSFVRIAEAQTLGPGTSPAVP